MKLPEGKSRLDLVKSGLTGGLPKRGRFIVSIDRLLEDPDNERKTFSNMDDMIESVRRHGIIEPITVTPDGEHYRILTGHRRFRAAKAVGLPEIEVLVREPDDSINRRFKSLISNIQRENIGAVELAETLRALLDSGAVTTQRELARQVGKSEQWMSGMLRVLELPARVQEELRTTSAIGYEMAQRIAQVSDTKLQDELVIAAKAGESTRSIRHRIDSHLAQQGGSQSKRQRTALVIHLTHKQGTCIATVKARREPQAREAMLTALRHLEQQVRDDDSLR
ncbi:ParB/RepB/Spo0J family partition protein [Prosthecobacter sp.]|uniref:ParB/RepB/Spo0J family partition protein n=1 Tax=Prosthecobacter sp. TaxID=1965333 RepID=UPI00248855DB|nr:ParB/RepB/Spo0J family partition protein [Prosthecobacter sp.]MDI1312007.1 ParB/RepB/Spo0J family partition protein [Prosthecobacter sp.]